MVSDADRVAALIAIVDLLIAELPGFEIRVDGRRVDADRVRRLVRQGVGRVCSGRKIGEA